MSGARKAVMMPERPMARPPKAPAHAVCGEAERHAAHWVGRDAAEVEERTADDGAEDARDHDEAGRQVGAPAHGFGHAHGDRCRDGLRNHGDHCFGREPEEPAEGNDGDDGGHAACEKAAGEGQPELDELLALLEERHSEHHGRGPEQEVNDACALEVLLVGHAHDEQHDDDAHDGHDDRREERIELRELVEMLAEDKGDERDGKPDGGIAEDRRELLKNVLHGQSLFLFLCTSLSTKMMV